MRPALLVIDCQNDFIKDMSPYACQMLDDTLVGRIDMLIQYARTRGVPVVYTQHSINPDKSNAEAGEGDDVRACIVGTKGWEIVAELAPRSEDVVVRKDKYDVFLDTNLDTILRTLGVDTLVMCGVLTNNCVRATTEGAHYRRYKTIIVSDCCGATSYVPDYTHEQIHDLTLRDMEGRIYELSVVKAGQLAALLT
ncbi:MAG: isochorismatase family cysteine hydrolase [Patescibacteria group bacterium]|mgnify:CR=1 FL=1